MKKKKAARRKAIPIAKKTPFLYLLILFLLGWVFYGNTLTNDYNFDDHLVTNGHPLTSQGLKAIPQIINSPYYIDAAGISFGYRPATLVSFAIEHQLFGENPMISHGVNVLLYALTSILIFLLLKLMVPATGTIFPFLASLVFLVHPIHSEAVNNIKSRDELLALLFSLLASFAFLKAFDKKVNKVWLACGFLAFGIGILSKLSALPFMVVIPLILVLFRRINIKQLIGVSAVLTVLGLSFIADIPMKAISLAAVGSLVFPVFVHFIANAKTVNGQSFLNIGSQKINFEYNIKEWLLLFFLAASILFSLLIPGNKIFVMLAWSIGSLVLIFFDTHAKNLIPLFVLGLYVIIISTLNLNTEFRIFSLLPLLLFVASPSLRLKSIGSIPLLIILGLIIAFQLFIGDVKALIPVLLMPIFLFLSVQEKKVLRYSGIALLVASAIGTLPSGDFYMSALFGILTVYALLELFKNLPISRYRLGVGLLGICGVIVLLTTFVEMQDTPAIPLSGMELVNSPTRVLDYSENPFVYEGSRLHKVAGALTVTGMYLKLLIVPAPFRYYFGYNMIPLNGLTIYSLLALLLLLSGIWFSLISIRKNPLITLGLVLLVGGLFQFSNLLFPVAGILGERLIYVGSLGFCILTALFLSEGIKWLTNWNPKSGPLYFWGFMAGLVILSAFYVNKRNLDWKDPLTLFRKDMPHLEASAKAHNVLANSLFSEALKPENQSLKPEYLQEAISRFKSCIDIYPKFPYASFDLGNVYMQTGDQEKALIAFLESTKVDSHNGEAYIKSADLYEAKGNVTEAIKLYDQAIKISPNIVEPYVNLSAIYFGQQNFEEGLAICQLGLQIFPNHTGILNNTGNAIANLGAFKEAATYFEAILSQEPGNTAVIQKIIILYEQSDQPERANQFRVMLQ